MTTFYLIRHAERAGDQEAFVGRTPGVHLTDRGRRQAEWIARRLAENRLDRVFASPLERARETAGPLARAWSLPVEVLPEIGELDAGAWTGARFPQLDVEDPTWRRFNRLRSLTPIPGGEAPLAVQARIVGEMVRLHAAHPEGSIALVSHGDPLKFALACLLGMPLDFHGRLEVGLGSVSVVALDDAGPRVLRLNETSPE